MNKNISISPSEGRELVTMVRHPLNGDLDLSSLHGYLRIEKVASFFVLMFCVVSVFAALAVVGAAICIVLAVVTDRLPVFPFVAGIVGAVCTCALILIPLLVKHQAAHMLVSHVKGTTYCQEFSDKSSTDQSVVAPAIAAVIGPRGPEQFDGEDGSTYHVSWNKTLDTLQLWKDPVPQKNTRK